MKSTAAAEILAVSASIDEGKTTPDTINMLIGKSLYLTIVADSKDLYNALCRQRNPINRSIRTDVNIIRYE